MSVVQQLMKVAAADTDVLESLDKQGDNFSVPRKVDFLFLAESQEKAAIVAGFINAYQYGVAIAQQHEGEHSVCVEIHMPVLQNVVLSVSGFMACIAQLFGVEYDGWGCKVQKQ
jgi:hypothetical protein